jgi:predicted AAA+ superfamily ATPase
MNYKRRLSLPSTTLFLWGPRQTGKTTLLKATFPDAYRIDLLKTDELVRLKQAPSLLREELALIDAGRIIVIDEIQKMPQLLDEVHYLIQEESRSFALCGSSARKVCQGHANLLGGRALRFELLGLSSVEIGADFSLEKALNAGGLPNHYLQSDHKSFIRSYVTTYLKEEILAESLVRNFPAFSDFLRLAALSDSEIISYSNIARESGVATSTVRDYFSVLEDTLLGAFVPAFTSRPKRRVIHAPKFYFRDIGVVNHLARRGDLLPGSSDYGKAFENWIFHELSVHSRYSDLWYDISYWRLSSGSEVDFILGDAEVALGVKAKKQIRSNDIKNLLEFKKDYPAVKHLIIVSLEDKPRKTDHGILILPFTEFIKMLWSGEFIS